METKQLIPVIYIENEEKHFFAKSHHFKARTLEDDQVEVIDWLGRGNAVILSKSEFTQSFLLITGSEFSEYENYINEGETTAIDEYLTRLRAKYSNVDKRL